MGDSGFIDTAGYVHVIGRIKDDIILKNTRKTNAALIEKIIFGSNLAIEVAVKGIPSNSGNDDIHAFIYTKFVYNIYMYEYVR